MNPEERFYKILSDSKYILTPNENTSQIFEYFQKACKDCSWYKTTNEIESRMFETNVKNYFGQFKEELIEFAKSNPPTFKRNPDTLKNIGLCTMDDQGFEGQVLKSGFYRWINDEIKQVEELKKLPYYCCTDEELESKWQGITNRIKNTLMKMYNDKTPKNESKKLREKIEKFQVIQEEIQTEITRRHKN